MELLKCEAVTKLYGTSPNQVTALKQLNLCVARGEFIAVTGASGSGKSTLLHLIGGVDTPTQGRIFISCLSAEQTAIFRRRKVGLVYQFYNLIPTLDVKKNILLPMLLDGRRPEKDYFDQLIRTLGLADKLDSLPSQLSGGQQQRAAIARSLLYRPALLLADEPTGNLDRRNSEEIIELLKLSNRSMKQTILLVTHDEQVALEADRIITIEDGSICSDKAVK
jgi:putative ABC transport system ATP-binding protein